jgi:quinol monooxygenase YgiN
MAKYALLVELKAKPGLEAEVEKFLAKEADLTRKEPGTLSWHATKIEGATGEYRIFDTFDTVEARQAHMDGPGGAELVAEADRLFAVAPQVHFVTVVAQK